MKKNVLIISFIFILITGLVFFFPKAQENTQVEANTTVEKKEDFLTVPQTPTPVLAAISAPKVQRHPAAQKIAKRNLRHQKIQASELELLYPLSEKLFLVKDITPIPESEFTSTSGEVIFSDFNFKYVRSTESSSEFISVYDSEEQRLKTISPVIKIRNVDEAKRNEIVAQGFQEQLYFDKFKILFVQTKGYDFSTAFDLLKNEGYAPQFQEIDRFYKTK